MDKRNEVSVAELWDQLKPYSRPISVGTHSYLPDGRPLVAGFATDLVSGSFKERGALAKMLYLKEQGYREVVGQSAGNHAAGVALGARALDMYSTIFMPEYVPSGKVLNTQELGGDHVEVRIMEGNIDDARNAALEYARKEHTVMVDPSDRYVGLGQGTVAREFLMKYPDLDYLSVPAGYRNLALGCIEAIKQLGLRTKVVGVKLASEKELCEGAYVDRLSDAALETIHENSDLWGGLLHVSPADVGRMVHMEDRVRVEHQEAMGEAAFVSTPEATALLGAAAVHKYFKNFSGSVGTIISGSNADQSKLDTLQRCFTESHSSAHTPGLRVADGHTYRRMVQLAS